MKRSAVTRKRSGTQQRLSPHPRAMIVHVESDRRQVLSAVLSAQGYLATVASGLPEAHAYLQCMLPDVLLLDLGPGEQGLHAFLWELATRADAPATLVLSNEPKDAALALEFGIFFVRVPFEIGQLVGIVRLARETRRRPQLLGSKTAP